MTTETDQALVFPKRERPTRFYRFTCRVVQIFARLWLRMEIRGMENLPKQGAVLLLCTHTSFLDPPLIGAHIPREMHFLSREGILKAPIVGPIVKRLNTHPIRKGASDHEAIKLCRAIIREGYPLLFFPEGTRSRDGKLGPMSGGFSMIIAPYEGVPYLPIVFQDTYKAMPRGRIFPWPVKIVLKVGTLKQLPEKIEGENRRDYMTRCAEKLEAEFREMGAV